MVATVNDSLLSVFESLSLDELQDISTTLRAVITIKGQQVGLHLKVGDRVEWLHNNKHLMGGYVTKVNRTSVNVDTDRGPWRVHLTHIRQV